MALLLRMKIIDVEDTKFYMSDEFAERYESFQTRVKERHPYNVKYGFLKRRLFREAITANASQRNLSGYTVLESHGNSDPTEWVFHDRKWFSVQSWVDGVDGRTAALLVLVCNPAGVDLTSNESIVIFPKIALNLPEEMNARGHMRMFVPNYGHFDSNYRQLRSAVDRLKAA